MKLLKNNRFYILLGSVLLSLSIYAWVVTSVALGLSQVALLVQDYGLLSLLFLYLSLLAGPLCFTFPKLPFADQFMHARRAIGVAAFYFASLHGLISFFGQLGGFSGLTFLDTNYLLAISFGFIAFVIFALLTITSLDWAVEKLSFSKWKLLHRSVYLAGVLILIHIVMLGTHFSPLSSNVSQITYIGLLILLLLEAPRLDKLFRRFIPIPKFGLSFVSISILLSVLYFTLINPLFPPTSDGVSFDIHAAHRQLAKQALQESQNSTPSGSNISTSNIPGLSGDRTKRYTVSIQTDPPNPQPNEDVTIHFTVYDASSGNHISYFRSLYSKLIHFIIVNSELTYFTHIHPTEDSDGNFVITTQFPSDDIYHLYIEFWPYEGIEQQIAFTLPVGQIPSQLPSDNTTPDANKTKTFGDYAVAIDTHGGLTAKDMTLGFQTITFTIKDAKTGKPITNLKPYLDSFGHLTMINEKTYDFIHVHPYNLTPPPPNANGGPTVDFLPIGIYGPFKPGIYKVFAEFNPNNTLFTAVFTVRVQ